MDAFFLRVLNELKKDGATDLIAGRMPTILFHLGELKEMKEAMQGTLAYFKSSRKEIEGSDGALCLQSLKLQKHLSRIAGSMSNQL